MAHYCHICGRHRANERFSGRGHRDHICQDCQRLPKSERKRLDEIDEIHGFLRQSHISAKNLARLQVLAGSPDPEIARMAAAVHQVAVLRPYKKKRFKFLRTKDRELLIRLEELGLLDRYDDKLWDDQIDEEVEAGHLDRLLDEAEWGLENRNYLPF